MTTVIENQSSKRMFEDALRYTPGGVNSSARALKPLLIWSKAKGTLLTDVDGNEFLDYHAAYGPIVLGHNHPQVIDKVIEALQSADLMGNGTTLAEIELARRLCTHIPCAEKALLCITGSEATFHTIRLARAVTGRKKVLKFQGCFHGSNDYLSMNVITPKEKLGKRDPLSTGILEEVVDQTVVVDFNRIDQVEDALRLYKDEIAAIILEPIPHNVGCLLPKQEFLEGLRTLCDQHGVILIFDEVITGFRHGLGGYQKICGVTPDLTTMAKSMANGYPIAAVCGKAELLDRYQTAGGDVFFAGTYNGHPVGVAAALATIAIMEEADVHTHLFTLGKMLSTGLNSLLEKHGIPAQIAHFGSVVVPYFLEGEMETYTDLTRNNSIMDLAFRRGMIERNIFMLPIAMKRNHLTAAHTVKDVEHTLNMADDVLREIAKGSLIQ